MRISKEQARKNREIVVETAARLFRERGFDGVGVSDLMSAAGFTHGGFYNHFATKDALVSEALAQAWTEMAAERAKARGLPRLMKAYLSRETRKAPGSSCPAAALAGDVARQPDGVRDVFADGLEEMIGSVQKLLPEAPGPDSRTRAASLVASMVGALILSRAVPDSSPLADEMLEATLTSALGRSRL
ncbi:transcriptional regulator [Hyphomonas polymorpha PS728]|uniref:Transcriptional regulator n=1 Tax=Hyphomonas polymorpha PS728 TaxID=1280954 RepID=A0A062VA95_9PROT|nr:TetR/AcrR family transcriptional regulator [Hyphomonas polymorpha]KCZ97090.1 transcriptional regulator [Hyphomonas polymorpha PS728]